MSDVWKSEAVCLLKALLLLEPDMIEWKTANRSGLTLGDILIQQNDEPEWLLMIAWGSSNVPVSFDLGIILL